MLLGDLAGSSFSTLFITFSLYPSTYFNIIAAVMANYPISLKLNGRLVVVIGAGHIALRKTGALLAAGAEVSVVSGDIKAELISQWERLGIKLIKEQYSKSCLGGAFLVIAATNDHELNKQVYKDCRELKILCNVVDEPQLCDFFVPAVMKRGDLQIAVSTEGNCPAFAAHLRRKLESIFTDKYAEFLTELTMARKQIVEFVQDVNKRKNLLEQLVQDSSFEYFLQNGSIKWRTYADELISKEKQVN